MEIRFRIDPERMTFGDLIVAERAKNRAEELSHEELRDMMARHMTDEDDAFIPAPAARKILDNLTMAQMVSVTSKFYDAVMEVSRQTAVPPQKSTI